ncbi:hypothetical protein DMH04_25560 [Kibdelosporangium aridum]|uniref:Uncharacterized protein n=1 Tax=Kibdelosporangium aridum TaxID=2030 RepID=A0A428Z660_KIBAR|nr:hypothetical protein [Kibdelosporangium aridum]RSM82562.1 hypothetical protein DMH04_25560 [Kibdelosporangium aridum]
MVSENKPESVSDYLNQLMGGGKTGPPESFDQSISRATGLQAVVEDELGLGINRIQEQRTAFLRYALKAAIDSCKDEHERLGDPQLIGASELLKMPIMLDDEIEDALEKYKPSWVKKSDRQAKRDSRRFRHFIALFVAVEAGPREGWDEKTAQNVRRQDCAPAMANALMAYLRESRNTLRTIAQETYDYTLRESPSQASVADAPDTGEISERSTAPSSAIVAAQPHSLPLRAAVRKVLGSSEWPLRLLNLDEGSTEEPDWRAVLDGGELTPLHARHRAILERRVLFDGEECIPAEILERLDQYKGQTLFVTGDVGDGKTTYVNGLVASARSNQIFIRWSERSKPYKPKEVARFRDAVDKLLIEPTDWCLILVYEINNRTSAKLDKHLRRGLSLRESDDDQTVVILDGRTADYDRLKQELNLRPLQLLPLHGPTSARKWAELLEKARDRLVDEGNRDSKLDNLYPNLRAFLDSGSVAQERLLSDPRDPLLVKVIKAVYGQTLRQKVESELVRLDDADQHAYLHVCLASLVEIELSNNMLTLLAPRAKIVARSKRDPWIHGDKGHRARHHVIGQVLLETETSVTSAKIEELIGDYSARIRDRTFLDALMVMIPTVRYLRPVGVKAETDRLSHCARNALRRTLREVDNLFGALNGAAQDRYDTLCDYATTLLELEPQPTHDTVSSVDNRVWWLNLAYRLFEAAKETPEAPKDKRLEFQFLKLKHRELKLRGELDFRKSVELAENAAAYFDPDWSKGDYFGEVFRLCFDGLERLAAQVVEGERDADEADIEMMFRWLVRSYHKLQRLYRTNREDARRRPYHIALTRFAYSLLPPVRAVNLAKESWDESNSCGVPDIKSATLYAESALYLTGVSPFYVNADAEYKSVSRDERANMRQEAFNMLTTTAGAEPQAAELPLLMAVLQLSGQDLGGVDLSRRIEAALKRDNSKLNTAFANHTRALLASKPEERIRLLRKALDGYAECMRPDHKWMIRRMGYAWDDACRQLKEAGDSKGAADYRQKYEAMSDRKLT